MTTKIKTAKFVVICQRLGLNVLAQPSQFKVWGADPNKRFYIPGTKTVSKIELSGWTHPLATTWASVFPGKKAPSPKITHVVSFDGSELEVLRRFYQIASSLATVGLPTNSSSTPLITPSPETAIVLYVEPACLTA